MAVKTSPFPIKKRYTNFSNGTKPQEKMIFCIWSPTGAQCPAACLHLRADSRMCWLTWEVFSKLSKRGLSSCHLRNSTQGTFEDAFSYDLFLHDCHLPSLVPTPLLPNKHGIYLLIQYLVWKVGKKKSKHTECFLEPLHKRCHAKHIRRGLITSQTSALTLTTNLMLNSIMVRRIKVSKLGT